MNTQIEMYDSKKAEFIKLLRELVVGGRKLSDDQVIGRAAFAAQQGLDPISEVHTITDKDGKTMAHTMSINGLRRKNAEQVGSGQEILLEFVEIDKAKLPPQAAYGYECRMRDGASYTQWQRRLVEVGKGFKEAGITTTFQDIMHVVGNPPVTIGVGMVYTSELSPDWKDKNFNPIERAKKRAETNARHHRFSTNAPVYDGDDSNGFIVDTVTTDLVTTTTIDPIIEHKSESQLLSDLGYDVDPEPEHTPEPTTSKTVTREQANAKIAERIAVNRDGVPYSEIDSGTLNHMMRSISQAIEKNGVTPEEREELVFKLTEADQIIKERAGVI